MREQLPLHELLASAIDGNKNEATAYPWWMVVDPAKLGRPVTMENRPHVITGCIAGPFFSREAANAHLETHRHWYSKHAIVYCASGHTSLDWRALLTKARAEQAAAVAP